MNQQQLRLTELLGSKELTFGCVIKNQNDVLLKVFKVKPSAMMFILYSDDSKECIAQRDFETGKFPEFEIIWHPATLTDFHKWLNENKYEWQHDNKWLVICKVVEPDPTWYKEIPYDSSLSLLNQKPEVLQQIIDFITSNS